MPSLPSAEAYKGHITVLVLVSSFLYFYLTMGATEMSYEEADIKYLNNSSSLCRNGYLSVDGGLNFITEKSENFHFFLHQGNSMLPMLHFKYIGEQYKSV